MKDGVTAVCSVLSKPISHSCECSYLCATCLNLAITDIELVEISCLLGFHGKCLWFSPKALTLWHLSEIFSRYMLCQLTEIMPLVGLKQKSLKLSGGLREYQFLFTCYTLIFFGKGHGPRPSNNTAPTIVNFLPTFVRKPFLHQRIEVSCHFNIISH